MIAVEYAVSIRYISGNCAANTLQEAASRSSALTLKTVFQSGIYVATAVAFLALAAPARAQHTPDLRPGNFELGLYGGASYGVDSFRPMGGVNLSYSLPKLLLPYVEFSYFPELLREYTSPNGSLAGTVSSRLVDFHGGVHVRFIKSESRVVPYGVVGLGVLNSHTTGYSYPTDSKLTAAQRQLGRSTVDIKSTDPALNFGAGLRVYHTSFFGYRAEFKVYRPMSGDFTKFFSKTEGGIFFQFGGH
jgi:hypothetical protein